MESAQVQFANQIKMKIFFLRSCAASAFAYEKTQNRFTSLAIDAISRDDGEMLTKCKRFGPTQLRSALGARVCRSPCLLSAGLFFLSGNLWLMIYRRKCSFENTHIEVDGRGRETRKNVIAIASGKNLG